jgi:ABC-type multidrug transport system fused ATPase/permease subunit
VDFYGNIVLSASIITTIYMLDSLDPIFAALTLNYVMTLKQNLNVFINLTFQMENQMVNANRCMMVTEIIQEKHEGELSVKKMLADERQSWPENGNLEFDQVVMRYRPTTYLVLKNISFNINGGERIGVVGRTGAGKSTLANVITRMCEIDSGKVLLDGVDISKIGLQKLRSSMTIIPQDPSLLSGTVKENIDP